MGKCIKAKETSIKDIKSGAVGEDTVVDSSAKYDKAVVDVIPDEDGKMKLVYSDGTEKYTEGGTEKYLTDTELVALDGSKLD